MENFTKDVSESLARELQELVQCPVCLGSLDESVSQCRKGHGVCGGCRKKLTECPTCTAEFLLEKPTLLCQLLEKIPKPCPFTDEGCSETITTNDHKSICQFRPVQCKMSSCSWEGCLKNLFNHVRNIHEVSCLECRGLGIKIGLSYPFDTANQYIRSIPLIVQSNFFWVWCHRDGKTKRILYRFYYLPTSNAKDNYYLIVSFKKDKIEITHTVKACNNMDNSDRDVDANDSELTIPDHLLKLFLANNGYYSCTFEVIKT